MISIFLPDGAVLQYHSPVTIAELVQKKECLIKDEVIAIKANEHYLDESFLINQDITLSFITTSDVAALEIIRHSTAHLLAHAVKRLYSEAQVAIGPVIENGFYYDVSCKEIFTPDTFALLEKEMRALVKENQK